NFTRSASNSPLQGSGLIASDTSSNGFVYQLRTSPYADTRHRRFGGRPFNAISCSTAAPNLANACSSGPLRLRDGACTEPRFSWFCVPDEFSDLEFAPATCRCGSWKTYAFDVRMTRQRQP